MKFDPKKGVDWSVGDPSGEPLTEEETKHLRTMIQADMRRNWLAGGFYRWTKNIAVWVTAVFGAYLIIVEVILKRVGE